MISKDVRVRKKIKIFSCAFCFINFLSANFSLVSCSSKEKQKNLSSISLDIKNVKRDYIVGEKLDLSNLKVHAHYSDETSKEIPAGEYKTDPEDHTTLTKENNTVKVTYQGKQISFNIKVDIVVTNIELTPFMFTLDLKAEGDIHDVDIEATIYPSNATDKTIKWSSNDTNIADVNNGHVISKGKGSCIITACSSNALVFSTCAIKVVDEEIHVSSVEIDGNKEFEMKKGEQKKLNVSFIPNNATDQTVIWSSSNLNVATIDNNGLLVAKNSGVAIITCYSCDDSELTDFVVVTVS